MRLTCLLLLALFGTSPIWADSVTLKTGEKLVGTIKDETATDVTIDVSVSASITDERVIQKSDIASVEKEQPDEIAYKQLIAVQPDPQTSFSSDQYDDILSSLQAFQTNYPNSTYLPEIKKLTAAFQDEKKRVDLGGVKYLGQWLTKDEAERRRIQIVGIQLYAQMQRQVASGDFIEAMQTFDSIDRGYNSTRSYPAAVTLALEVLPTFQQQLVGRMQEVKDDQDQLKKTLAFTAEPEKTRIKQAAQTEQDRGNAIVADALKSGAKWVPLVPRNLASITALQRVAATEYSRLRAVPVAAMQQSIARADAARNSIKGGDLKTGADELQQATQLWAANEEARYWDSVVKGELATPTPAPVAAATPKPKPTPSPGHIAIGSTGLQPVAGSSPTAEGSTATATPAPEAKPFFMTVPGALAIALGILIIGAIATTINQKRTRRDLER